MNTVLEMHVSVTIAKEVMVSGEGGGVVVWRVALREGRSFILWILLGLMYY